MEVVSDEEAFLFGMELAGVSAVSMVLKSALELGILETIAKAGPGAYLCPSHIAAEIPTIKNPHAPSMLDRMLRLLASYNIHTPSINCLMVRLKGTMVFTQKPNTLSNEDGVSVAAYFLMEHDKVLKRHVVPLADSVKEGGHPSSNAYGMTAFEFHDTNPRFNNLFNKGLSDISSITMKKILEIYNGFEGVGSVVDVGGGTGAIINMVAYPTTKCLNFDLPHVIKEAPAYTGVEHIGGDMFVSVPKGFLSNDTGKVILAEGISPETPDSNLAARCEFQMDVIMLCHSPSGKERTEKEYKAFAKGAGFHGFRIVFSTHVMEFLKKA